MLDKIKMPTDKHLIFFEDNDKYSILTEIRENEYSTLIEWEKNNTKIYNIEYLEGKVIASMVDKDNKNHLFMIDEQTKERNYLVTSTKTICKITDGVYYAKKDNCDCIQRINPTTTINFQQRFDNDRLLKSVDIARLDQNYLQLIFKLGDNERIHGIMVLDKKRNLPMYPFAYLESNNSLINLTSNNNKIDIFDFIYRLRRTSEYEIIKSTAEKQQEEQVQQQELIKNQLIKTIKKIEN